MGPIESTSSKDDMNFFNEAKPMGIPEEEVEGEQTIIVEDTSSEGRLCIAAWGSVSFCHTSDGFRIHSKSIHSWTSKRVIYVFCRPEPIDLPWMGVMRPSLEFGPVRGSYKSEVASQTTLGGWGSQLS